MSAKPAAVITNVVTAATLDSTGTWTCNQAIPPFDECIVRQIIYSNGVPTPTTYLINSSIGVIGAFTCVYNYCSSPQTCIQSKGTSSQLTFQITRNGAPSDVGGEVIICLDFIKYIKS